MAARSSQALSQALRSARAAVRMCSNTPCVRSSSQVVGQRCWSTASSRDWRTGSLLGSFAEPVSLFWRNFSAVGACRVGFHGNHHSDCRGWGASGSLSYSSLALEIRDYSPSDPAEIGYEVLGPYVTDGARIKPQAAFAVVQVGPHQFKVSPGDMIYTEKLKHADINDQLSLNKVLLLGSLKQTIIGRPIITDAAVTAVVEEHALDAKVIIFKKKRRKNYRRTNGHRQELTRLRILRIEGIGESSPGGDDTSLRENTD